MTYRYRLLPGGYVDETGAHRGAPPTPEDYARVALLTMHRALFARDLHIHLDMMNTKDAKQAYKAMESCADVAGKYFFEPQEKAKIEFQVHDPLPQQDVPSEIEFTQEMSVEEAKRRYPNTPIPGEEK
jgi:hypothetical protein